MDKPGGTDKCFLHFCDLPPRRLLRSLLSPTNHVRAYRYAQRARPPGPEGPPGRRERRNHPASIPLRCPERVAAVPSPPSGAAPAQHLWKVLSPEFGQEQVLGDGARTRRHERVRIVQSESDTIIPSRTSVSCLSQFQFRLQALQGELPGVRKASW